MTAQRLQDWEAMIGAMPDPENAVAMLGYAMLMRQGVKELTVALRQAGVLKGDT